MSDLSDHLKPSDVAADPEGFMRRCHTLSRISVVAFSLEHDVPVEVMSGLCRAARSMRITQISVPASPLGTPFNSEIDRLKAFVQVGNEHGIRIGLMTRMGLLTEDPHTAVELCQSVRGLGLALDPAHYCCGPHSSKSWDQVYPWAVHSYIRDCRDREVQVQVGLGTMDFAGVIQSLRKENYSRAMSVDFSLSGMDPEARPLEMRKLRLLLETLL